MKPIPKPLGDWLDAFFALLEASVETAADVDGLGERASLSKRQAKRMSHMVGTVNMEKLRERRHVWKRVRDRFGHFGDNCIVEEIGFSGMKTEPDGSIAVTDPVVRVQRYTDKTPVIFNSEEEISVVCRFFQFYRAYCESLDPSAFVRAVLAKRGITAENFLTHPSSPAGMIRNPFLTDLGG
jgi:hypothetical protein